MKYQLLILATVGFVVAALASKEKDEIPDEITQGTSETNPGVELRITKKAFEYFIKVAGRIINNELKNLKIPAIEKSLKELNGQLSLENLRVIKFREPDSYNLDLLPPDKLKVGVKNLDLTVKSFFETYVEMFNTKMQVYGNITSEASHFSMEATAAISKSDKGTLELKATDCTAHMDSLTMDMAEVKGNAANLFRQFKGMIEGKAKEMMEKIICKQLKKLINEDFNKKLSSLGTVVPLKRIRTGKENSDESNLFSPSDDDVADEDNEAPEAEASSSFFMDPTILKLDHKLIRNPKITESYLESSHKAEISMRPGSTPFNPPQMPEISGTDRMVYVYASDYVVNSLLYAMFKEGNASVHINQYTNPELDGTLTTDCKEKSTTAEKNDETFCFGNLFPVTKKKFPNNDVEINLVPTAMPYILDKSDGMTFVFDGLLYVFGSGSEDNFKEEWIKSAVTVKGESNFEVKDNKIFGSIEVTDMTSEIKDSKLEIDDNNADAFDKIKNLLKATIQDRFNEQFNRGIPIPALMFTRLVSPKVGMIDRGVSLETDLEINEEKLQERVHKAIQVQIKKLANDDGQDWN